MVFPYPKSEIFHYLSFIDASASKFESRAIIQKRTIILFSTQQLFQNDDE
ncbi:hypothetical protein ACNANW_02415 [Campylobacter jejuni]